MRPLISLILGLGTVAAQLQQRSAAAAPTLSVTSASLTSKWSNLTTTAPFVQILEIIVENTHATNWLSASNALSLTVTSSSLNTVTPGSITRLRPGQSAIAQIGVQNKAGVAAGAACNATIVLTWKSGTGTATGSHAVSGQCGIGDYSASKSSLNFHWNPDWYNEVKFGIFIHWGLYAAPAYGSVAPNEDYAEWYWYRQHDPSWKTKTYQYHQETYGTSFNYDQFISNFTGTQFNAQAWMQLVADAGARYVVPVTKHHDGFALFNFSTSISERSSVNYGPKRDFIGELLAAAKTYQPQIRRGTYFSLPEWYNPLYKPYAMTNFPGGPPINPYTNATLTYTGFVPVKDFVVDIQLPQMNTLAYTYDTDIMWCDIGGANNSTLFASAWLNWARDQAGRQVTFNNRCGLTGDFDTPEYTTNAGSVARKWESNRGMDPFSFGFNYQTPASAYLTPGEIVNSLVDIVSKNGNFLLDIGPHNDGSIADIMSTNLRGAGAWIHAHAESIFSTRYWLTTPGTGNFRYTTTDAAFYIHYIATPGATILITDPIPYLAGDEVTVIGGSLSGTTVPITANSNGTHTLTVSAAVKAADQFVWTFRILYTVA